MLWYFPKSNIEPPHHNACSILTTGDSYVAVTGLPEPQERHAVIMARFAGECMLKLHEIVTDLEITLGPDTGDLSMRFGLHSGPGTYLTLARK